MAGALAKAEGFTDFSVLSNDDPHNTIPDEDEDFGGLMVYAHASLRRDNAHFKSV